MKQIISNGKSSAVRRRRHPIRPQTLLGKGWRTRRIEGPLRSIADWNGSRPDHGRCRRKNVKAEFSKFKTPDSGVFNISDDPLRFRDHYSSKSKDVVSASLKF